MSVKRKCELLSKHNAGILSEWPISPALDCYELWLYVPEKFYGKFECCSSRYVWSDFLSHICSVSLDHVIDHWYLINYILLFKCNTHNQKGTPLNVGRCCGSCAQHLFISWMISTGVSPGMAFSAGRSPLRTHWLIWSSLLATGHRKDSYPDHLNHSNVLPSWYE